MASSRMDHFLELIGGEANLPPQLPQPPPPQSHAHEEDSVNGAGDAEDHNLNFNTLTLAHVEELASASTSTSTSNKPPTNISKKTVQAHLTQQAPFLSTNGDVFESDSRCGQPAPLGITFSPWLAVTKFCYKFVAKEWQQPLATAIFDANKIWDRDWDLYYIWSDHYPTERPVVFVPESQVQALMQEINEQFPKINAKISDNLREEGFILDFNDSRADLRPRWLGQSKSRAQHEYWTSMLPMPPSSPDNTGQDRSLEAFKANMAAAREISKMKSKKKRDINQQAKIAVRMAMTKMTLRSQRYLGLLPRKDSVGASMTATSIQAIDVKSPAPFPFDQEPIIISFDVEAWEKPPHPITEVGVATLDTRDLKDIAPGRVGEDWQKLIRGRHFRISEYKYHVNGLYVAGCPDHFEFGDSEFVSKDNIAQVLATCFKQPYSRSDSTTTIEQRNLIILGHDLPMDVNYLQQLGFNILDRSNIIEAMDSANMYRSYTREPNPRSLGSILADFDLTGWHLHNAGNDAVYTIWAMLAISIKEASERGSTDREQTIQAATSAKAEAAVQEAKERVLHDGQGWDSNGDEDGGEALPPKEDFQSKREMRKRLFGPDGPAPTGRWTSGGAVLDV